MGLTLVEKIAARHADGLPAGAIVRAGDFVSIRPRHVMTHDELFDRLNKSLKNKFSGNISWYGETVKLDLEARKIIERTSSKPQKYGLKLK